MPQSIVTRPFISVKIYPQSYNLVSLLVKHLDGDEDLPPSNASSQPTNTSSQESNSSQWFSQSSSSTSTWQILDDDDNPLGIKPTTKAEDSAGPICLVCVQYAKHSRRMTLNHPSVPVSTFAGIFHPKETSLWRSVRNQPTG